MADEVVHDEGDRGREIVGREDAKRGGHNKGGAGEDDNTLPWEGGWGKKGGAAMVGIGADSSKLRLVGDDCGGLAAG